MPREPLSAVCVPANDGWSCAVTVGQPGSGTSHQVTVSRAELEQLAPGMAEPGPLVEESFRFLLEREAKESILARFAIGDIRYYFPEYGHEITARLGRLGTHGD